MGLPIPSQWIKKLQTRVTYADIDPADQKLSHMEINRSNSSKLEKAILKQALRDSYEPQNSVYSRGGELVSVDIALYGYGQAFSNYDTSRNGHLNESEMATVPAEQRKLMRQLNQYALESSGTEPLSSLRVSDTSVTGDMAERFNQLTDSLVTGRHVSTMAHFKPRATITEQDAAAIHNAIVRPIPGARAPQSISEVNLERLRADLRDDFLGNSYSALETALDKLVREFRSEHRADPQIFLLNRGEGVGASVIFGSAGDGTAYHLEIRPE